MTQQTTFFCDNCGSSIPDPTQRLIITLGQVGCNNVIGDACQACAIIIIKAWPNFKFPQPYPTIAARPANPTAV